jgi:hypothetical protein
MSTKHRFCIFLEHRQADSIAAVADQAGMTQAELLRRIIDHGLQEQVLNALVPPMSGQMSTSLRRD